MSLFYDNILQIFGLFIGIIILCRIIYIFIYPLFCYFSSKIYNNNNDDVNSINEDINVINVNRNNIIIPSSIDFTIKNIPVVDVEYCSNEEKSDSNTPIARII